MKGEGGAGNITFTTYSSQVHSKQTGWGPCDLRTCRVAGCRRAGAVLFCFGFFFSSMPYYWLVLLLLDPLYPSKQSSLRLRKVCKPQHSVACDDAFRLCPPILQSCDSSSAIESVTLSLTSAVLCDRSRLSGALFETSELYFIWLSSHCV